MNPILRLQKYYIILLILILNVAASSTFIIYEKMWYIFIGFLSLGSLILSISVINITLHKLITSIISVCRQRRIHPTNTTYTGTPRNYVYVIPCYNESAAELRGTLNSVTRQLQIDHRDNPIIIIICDGIIQGDGNTDTTNNLLLNIIREDSSSVCEAIVINDPNITYKTADGRHNQIDLHCGIFRTIPFLLFVKHKNYGKRDSLVFVRRLLFYYNKWITVRKINMLNMIVEWFNNVLWSILTKKLFELSKTPINYIIGTDADTILDDNCTRELISSIEVRPNIMGCVGFVDIAASAPWWSPFTIYQTAEYYFAQMIKRQHQSLITGKVNCLSGCVQILRVSMETCGPVILSRFNYIPDEDDSIFGHIRSYASEDRNHVCLMLSLYPYVNTVQNIRAIAYTNIPQSVRVLLSQRRRWTLGAISNDILLLTLGGINWWERIAAFVNVVIFMLTPFIFIATAYFVRAIVEHATLLMLYLSLPMIIPLIYVLYIPIELRLSAIRMGYFYGAFVLYVVFGPIINMVMAVYALINMDVLTWGKTRRIMPPYNMHQHQHNNIELQPMRSVEDPAGLSNMMHRGISIDHTSM